MRFKRAIGMSVLAYIASFVVAAVAAMAMGVEPTTIQDLPVALCLVVAAASTLIAILFALWYFRSPNLTPNAQEGFKFGLMVIAAGVILDMLLLIPVMPNQSLVESLSKYYLNPFLWLTIALVLLATTLTGYCLKNKK